MRFLIAGLGSIGRRHLRNLLALGESDIVLYRTHLSSLPDDELADFPVETSQDAALARNPDAVIVANPTAQHLAVAIPAAEAGCHLLLEKPISHSLDRVDALQAALGRGGGQVLVGFQFRFHPGLRLIADLLKQGAIGNVLSARAHWGEYLPTWHPWEDYRKGYSARADLGGGVILTLCHPLDYLRWLLGEVHSVWSFASRLSELDIDVEDTAEIGLKFASGALGSVHLDYNQRPVTHNLELVGDRGTLRWDNASGATHIYQEHPGSGTPGWQVHPPPPDFERNHLFLAEMRHFIQVARGEVPPLCTLDDGVQALRLALAARKSAQEGQQIYL